MPVELVTSSSVNQYTRKKPYNDNISDGSAFRVYDAQEKTSTKVKVGVFLTTLAGITAAMLTAFKYKGMKLKNPIDFLKG